MGFNQVQVDRPAAFLRRVFSLKGSDDVSVEKHITPVTIMEDFTRDENLPQGGVTLFSIFKNVPATAAQSGYMAILPSAIQGLLVITGVSIAGPAAASTFDIGAAAVDAGMAAAVPAQVRYSNGGAANQATPAMVSFGSNLAAPTASAQLRVQVGASGQLTVPPGFFPFVFGDTSPFCFKVVGTVVNNAFNCSIAGYYRPQLDSEL